MSVNGQRRQPAQYGKKDEQPGTTRRANERRSKGRRNNGEMSAAELEHAKEMVAKGHLRCKNSIGTRVLVSRPSPSMDIRYPEGAELLGFARAELRKPRGQRKSWERLCATRGMSPYAALQRIQMLQYATAPKASMAAA